MLSRKSILMKTRKGFQMQFLTRFKIKDLEDTWQWPDIKTENDGKNFCAEELEIPYEYLKAINLYHEELHLTLRRDKRYIRDDWYVNLTRISA